MNFDFSDDQKLLQNTAREFLEERSPIGVVRRILDSDEPLDRELWAQVAEMGWLGSVVPEDFGGAGFGYLELALLAEELGRALAPIPFASSVYLATEALRRYGTETQRGRYLPQLVNGEKIGTAALFAASADHGVQTTFKEGRIRGRILGVPDGGVANLAVVSARMPDGRVVLVVVELDGTGVQRREVASLDPTRPLAVIEFDEARAELLSEAADEGAIDSLRDRAAILMAFEQLGGAQRCLEMAKDYAMNRYAFGRPIASFQAPKHRLVDMFVEVELARSNCYFAAATLNSENDELPVAACLARISATDAYERCARDNLQLHGGVGFTWEYDCHLFLRRSVFLAVVLDRAETWKRRLVERLRRSALRG